MILDISTLGSMVADDAAFRRRQRLQPVGGPGDKVFPPTYPSETRDGGPRHVLERRIVDGNPVWTVLLDSVQSSVNRSEESLLAAARRGEIELPYLSVSFADTEVAEIGEITSLDAPHRIFDAIFRDSELDGVPLMRSALGRELVMANMGHAAVIFETCPTALLFGAWNSTGEGGGLGAKFPRCYVSEIVGVDIPVDTRDGIEATTAARRPGSRIDPLGILKGVPVYKGPADWDSKAVDKTYKKSKPSEINHGNIAPSISAVGATMAYAEQTVVISFAGLRRLSFGNADRSRAARSLLAALGLVAHLSQAKHGFALRSRCDLVYEGTSPLEVVHFDGSIDLIDIDYPSALNLYSAAVAEARKVGFTYDAEPLHLTPQAKLVYLVRQSRELALIGKGGEVSGDSSDAGP